MSLEAEARRAARANCEVRVFGEGDAEREAEADALYWDRIPVSERAEFVWRLSLELHQISNPTERHEPRLLNLLRAFSDAEARFLVVGAYAVGVHGRPRATKDLDVWVEASEENAPHVMRGLVAFGAPLMGLTESDLSKPGLGLQIGVEPGRIDVLTKITGLAFEEAWPGRVQADFGDGVRCNVIGLSELLRNKRASARPQDLADVDALERLHRAKKP